MSTTKTDEKDEVPLESAASEVIDQKKPANTEETPAPADEVVADEDIVIEVPDDIEDEGVQKPLIQLDVSDDDAEDEKKDETKLAVEEVDEADIAEGTEIIDLTSSVEEVDGADVTGDDEVIEVACDSKGAVTEEDDVIDCAEHVNALVGGDISLSEEFKAKASTIFSAAIKSKLTEEKQKLRSAYNKKLNESAAEYRAQLVEKVDAYLNTVVDQWMMDNKVTLTNNLRSEVAEGFISSLKNLFAESYIEVPAEKVDISEKLKNENAKLTESLASERKALAAAKAVNAKLMKAKIVAEAADDLTSMQSDKLAQLAENVVFVDETSFKKSVDDLKESYFRRSVKPTTTLIAENASAINKKAAGSLVGSTAALLDQ